MAGIYIHIPYCKTKCNYCDFYSIVNKSTETDFTAAVKKEMKVKKDFLPRGETIETIYFGGGTPSFIETENLRQILNAVYRQFSVSEDTEITMEVNPDDINRAKAQNFRQLGVNRISMGVQSFLPEQLRFMQRRHSVQQAFDAIDTILQAGISNMSIDLIYGLPQMSLQEWENSLDKALQLPVHHLSVYHLTVEPGTLLHRQVKSGQVEVIDDELSYSQFELLMNKTAQYGFEHYEISNFAREGHYSLHNTSYWQNKPYLGLGPSAHSYNLEKRCFNVANVHRYISGIFENKAFYECEILSDWDKFNEKIITHLRMRRGISEKDLLSLPGYAAAIDKTVSQYEKNGYLERKNGRVCLSRKGIHIADRIMTDLMVVK